VSAPTQRKFRFAFPRPNVVAIIHKHLSCLPASERFVRLFGERVSILEVQNRALIKTAGERAERIDQLERELQQGNREIERLQAECEFYSKRVAELEEQNRQLTESATKYSLWGQKLERELVRIDPNGAPRRRFGAQREE
jgi:seryl-tRNA synthetase